MTTWACAQIDSGGGKVAVGNLSNHASLGSIVATGSFTTGTNTNRQGLIEVLFSGGSPNQDSNGNGLPDSWESQHFSGQTPDPLADADGDGTTNLMEFLLGGSPVVSSQSILPTLATVGSDAVLSFTRSDESESVTTQVGQWSTNLTGWTDVTPVLVNENGAAADTMSITVPMSNAVNGKLFLRLSVEMP